MKRSLKPNPSQFQDPLPDPSKPPALPPVEGGVPQGMDLINHVAECLRLGCDRAEIRARLMGFGFSEANAEKLLNDTAAWMEKNPNARHHPGPATGAGQFNGHMLVGILILLIGIGITAATFFAASTGGGGGRYIIAWGAMLFGVIEILRGFGPSKS